MMMVMIAFVSLFTAKNKNKYCSIPVHSLATQKRSVLRSIAKNYDSLEVKEENTRRKYHCIVCVL